MRLGIAWPLACLFFGAPASDTRAGEPRGAIVFLSGSKLLGARGHPDKLETLQITSKGSCVRRKGGWDLFVAATDPEGTKQWEYIDGAEVGSDYAFDASVGPDGRCFFVGSWYRDNEPFVDGYLGILDASSGKP